MLQERKSSSERDLKEKSQYKETNSKLSPRCIDGREDSEGLLGPQMLGGSMHLLLLSSLYHGRALTTDTTSSDIHTLQWYNYAIGDHRGSHKNNKENKSDCGFVDGYPTIMLTALQNKDKISQVVESLYKGNKEQFDTLITAYTQKSEFSYVLANVWQVIEQFLSHNATSFTGEEVISHLEDEGAYSEDVAGHHEEEKAYINCKIATTFDTHEANRQEHQSFNLDIWAVLEQADLLNVDSTFALAASLVLYVATEMVLVEQKGKPALPILVHT